MALEGLLSQLDLATLLQTLDQEKKEGILTLFRGESRANLYIAKDGVRYLASESGDNTDLLEVLYRHRFIKRDQLPEYEKMQKEMGLPLGEVLFQKGVITEDDLRQVMAPFFAEKIFNLFDWNDGSFRFEKMPPDMSLEFFHPESAGLFVTFDTSFLNLELVRRRDEWKKFRAMIPSDECIFVINEEVMAKRPYNKEDFNENCRKILHLLDGRKNVAELREHSGLSNFDTYTALFELYSQNLIKMLDVSHLIQEAEQLYQEERFFEGNQRFKAAIKINPNNLPLRMAFAKRCLERGEMDEGADQFFHIGWILKNEGKWEEARKAFMKAFEIAPKDKEENLEKYFYFLLEVKEDESKVWEVAKKLASMYYRGGKLLQVRTVYENFLKVFPQHRPAKVALIGVYRRQGDIPHLKEALESLADYDLAQGDYKTAHANYGEVYKLDPQRVDILQKMKGLEQFITMDTQKQRKRVLWAFVYLYIFAGFLYFGYLYLDYSYSGPKLPKSLQIVKKGLEIKEKYSLLKKKKESSDQLEILQELAKNLISIIKEGEVLLIKDPGLQKPLEEYRNLYAKIVEQRNQILKNLKTKNYETLKQAVDLERKGKYQEALKVYKALLKTPFHFSKVPSFIQERIHEISKIRTQIQVIQKKVRILVQKRAFQKALDLAIQNYSQFLAIGLKSRFRIPFYLETIPPKAKVFLNGAYLGMTPILLEYSPQKWQNLRIELTPFETLSFDFQGWISKKGKLLVEGKGKKPLAIKFLKDLQKGQGIYLLDQKPRWTAYIPKHVETFCFNRKDSLFIQINLGGETHIYRMNPQTGKILSSFRSFGFASALRVFKIQAFNRDFLLYSSNNQLFCLYEKRGTFVPFWNQRFMKNIEFISTNTDDDKDQRLALATEDGTLYVVKSVNGSIIRSFPTNYAMSGPPLIVKDSVLFACKDGRLFGQKIEGGQFWEEDLTTLITSPLYFADDLLFVGCEKGQVYSFHPFRQKTLWSWQSKSQGNILKILYAKKKVIAFEESHKGFYLHALDLQGNLKWTFFAHCLSAKVEYDPSLPILCLYNKSQILLYYLPPKGKPRLYWKKQVKGQEPITLLLVPEAGQKGFSLYQTMGSGKVLCYFLPLP